MNMMAANDHRLSLLVTSKNICRRDSLSSSRTRDSGYNSDPEVSLSPLDFLNSDLDGVLVPLPPVPEIYITGKTEAPNACIEFLKTPVSHLPSVPSVTSFAASAPTWTLFNSPKATLCKSHGTEAKRFGEKNLASQDEEIERWMRVDSLPSRDRPKERVSSIISLSSTSSCETYSSTDLSDAEPDYGPGTEQNLHLKSTLKVIEVILRMIEVNLCYAAYKQCAGNGDASRTRSNAAVWPQESGRKGSQSSGQKRKSRLEGSPPPEDDEDDGPNKRRRGSATTVDSTEVGVRFACPFYKHEPDRYRNRRTCPGPGWPTVHRMKEHLYRSHSQPIFCPLCYSKFSSDKEQSIHVRLQQCQRLAPQQMEGIDRETVNILKKRTTGLRLEEDKWREVYHVLFPEVPDGDIPSPFYDCDSPSEASRRFRRDLLRRVQEELLATAEQMPVPVEQRLLRQVAEIIRRCENELLHPSPSPYRRPSHSSIVSATSGPVSPPIPLPINPIVLDPPCGRVYPLPTQRPGHSNSQSPRRPPSSPPPEFDMQIPYPGAPEISFTDIPWLEPPYGEFDMGINWSQIFPTATALNLGGSEFFATLNVPAHT